MSKDNYARFYTYFNQGTYFKFKPNDKVYPPNDKPPTTSLEFHKSLVKFHNRPDCFILNDSGNPVIVN